jgi:hypothetical protein
VTVTEFTFLALGLLLGVAAGAALVEIFRARPPAAREVRVTVAQDAVPRRSQTLADDAFVTPSAEPAHGGPADRRAMGPGRPPGIPERRTSVRPGSLGNGGAAVASGQAIHTGSGREGPRRVILSATGPFGQPTAALRPIAVAGGTDPMLQAIRAMATSSVPAPVAVAVGGSTRASVLERPVAVAEDAAEGSSGATAPPIPVEAGPCGEARRLAAERCELATRAKAAAVEAEDALHAAQRAYDEHEARAEGATRDADAREIRAAKDAAQAAFRATRDGAARTEDVEAAARTWLGEINRINTRARDAAATVAREREAARTTALELERLGVRADAARIAAETAAAGCLGAREALAACEEQVATEPARREHDEAARRGPTAGLFREEPSPVGALATDGTPRIFRLLRGDRSAMTELVAAMAGPDAQERRRWQLVISDLVDAIVADAIAASVLHFPEDHPFWAPFTLTQDREIVGALSSLGFRFDGLGGWVDERTPSQRDLSLALGYAGLDPMRIRHWPTEAEMTVLFRDVTVAADEHLASVAGDLSLGEMVAMLGKRADGLAEAWNDWGRLRPLLLEEG